MQYCCALSLLVWRDKVLCASLYNPSSRQCAICPLQECPDVPLCCAVLWHAMCCAMFQAMYHDHHQPSGSDRGPAARLGFVQPTTGLHTVLYPMNPGVPCCICFRRCTTTIVGRQVSAGVVLHGC